MKRELDIVILSDVHLGTYGCHAKELHNYLKSIQPKTLILNGDFIDIWQFRKRYFPKEHLQVIQRILKMSARGTKVYYITGNHDEALRRYSDFSSGNIHLRDKLELQLNGKSYWIFHGDIFDVFIKYSPLMARLGGLSYDWLIYINRLVNNFRSFLGLSRMSFTKKIKDSVKKAVSFIQDFEDHAIRLGIDQGYDFVVCGHIHKPQIRKVEMEKGSITYLNSGDWIENLTALEYCWGEWSLYEYDESDFQYVNTQLRVPEAEGVEDLEEDDMDSGVSTQEIFQQILKTGSEA
ncbi:MAG TPA: UDP-2,3-diacylglucosamine diphosphatase [Saprospiraceae bacterium]|nr:UDP-2,3-diacylglucosamine diphosphatase [Saprospiraceae bacterium]